MKFTHALTALAAAIALAMAPAAAHADSYSQTDASGDVQGRALDAPGDDFVTDTNRALGDVVSSRVTHLGKRVRAKLQYRDLARTGRGHSSFFAIRSNQGLRYAFVDATRGRWAGRTLFQNARQKAVPCSGITHKVDYVANTVLISVPRSCLGNPRWVRVSLGTATFTSTSIYADDARITGDVNNPHTYGPRIYQ